MIAYLKGKVISIDNLSVILSVKGVGYKIFLGNSLLNKIKVGEEKEFFTFLRLRDDILSLYGFSSKKELDFFNQLISVSGVGPKSALHLIDTLGLKEAQMAIINKQYDVLTRAPGLGKKTAERIVVELKNKIINNDVNDSDKSIFFEDGDVVSALKGLGYGIKDINEVLRLLPKEVSGTDNKIKEALKLLGKNNR